MSRAPDGPTCRWDPPDTVHGQIAVIDRALAEMWAASGIPPVIRRIVVALIGAMSRR